MTLLHNMIEFSKESSYWNPNTLIQAIAGIWFAASHQPWIVRFPIPNAFSPSIANSENRTSILSSSSFVTAQSMSSCSVMRLIAQSRGITPRSPSYPFSIVLSRRPFESTHWIRVSPPLYVRPPGRNETKTIHS